jgi:hypothetical protein
VKVWANANAKPSGWRAAIGPDSDNTGSSCRAIRRPIGSASSRVPRRLPAFFHHEPMRGLKSSEISAILIERIFKMK